MGACMDFPEDPEDFLKSYSFKDRKEEYTNGDMLIQTFRVEQMIEHYFGKPKQDENLEEQGQLLRLPCRPNDIVYRINKAARVPIIKMAVKRIVLFDKSYALEVVDEYGGQLLFLADDIGKVLYITREEAEAKLAEMEESDEGE